MISFHFFSEVTGINAIYLFSNLMVLTSLVSISFLANIGLVGKLGFAFHFSFPPLFASRTAPVE